MKILFAGTPRPAAIVLEHLIADPRLEVAGVITQPDARRGRGRTLHPSPVAEVAEVAGIPVHKWASLGAKSEEGDDVRETLRGYREQGVSGVAVVAYGNLIPADLLDAFEHGWVNLHYSLLPRWRGAAPVQAAIAAGDERTGATIFRIEQGLDTGPMLSKNSYEIGIRDTAEDVLIELTASGKQLLADTLVELGEGKITPQEQPEEGTTHAPKIHPADARIDWSAPGAVIQRVARAHTPAPGAWSTLGGQRFKIGLLLPVEAGDELPELAAGELWADKKRVLVGTVDGLLEVASIQPPGKKMMKASDWARGQQELLAAGPRFEQADDGAEDAGKGAAK